ncbi:MAG: PEP/pyruvate-binding domain-containing protein [Granulosicoccus sp.]
MVSVHTLSFGEIGSVDHDRVGGKCASLGDMIRAGVAVPPGFAITTDAYDTMLDQAGLQPQITAQLSGLDTDDLTQVDIAADRIRSLIRATAMPDPVRNAITTAYAALGPDMAVAVRSSATAEDLPDASFAGQQDTYLWVVGLDAVLEKVRDCWASLFTSRAIVYRSQNNIPSDDVKISVAIQKMVNARAAGVTMTLDPANGDRTKIVIDASWGLGETVVSGTVTPDHFRVEKVLMEVLDRKIADKHLELVPDITAKMAVERKIDAERRTAPCLTDAEIIAVAQLAKSLEKLKKTPQDVEWAFDADAPDGANLFALQSRPETVWSQKTPAPSAPKTYGMGLSGLVSSLTTPLTKDGS